jgi:hypothetical protein
VATHWCRLHDEAVSAAAELRKQSAEKGWANRRYETTFDKRMANKFPEDKEAT